TTVLPLMPKSSCLLLSPWLVLAGCAAPAVPLPRQTRAMPMPAVRSVAGGNGRLDHLGYDPATERLFLPSGGWGSLEVLDLRSGAVVAHLPGLSQPQGIAIVPGTNAARVFVACGGDGTLRVFDAGTLQQTGTAAAGEDADNVHWDAHTGRVYVGSG